MPRGPRITCFAVRIRRKGLTLAGKAGERAAIAHFAAAPLQVLFDPTQLCRSQVGHLRTRLGADQASRSMTAPPGATATAIGTSATPYLCASPGRREPSTVTTVGPAARSAA